MSLEQTIFQAFVVPAKRRRYAELVATGRGRDRICFSLDHFRDLDPRFCRKIDPTEHDVSNILRILKSLGAPSACYLISSDAKLDKREMDLREALSEVVGRGQGTFISCVPGVLAYFEGEEPRERYVCHRRS
jgi:hypothetical protein